MKVKLKELRKLIRERLNKLTENQPKPDTTPRPGETETIPGRPPEEKRKYPFRVPRPGQLPKPKASNEGKKALKPSREETQELDKIMKSFNRLRK